MAPKVSDGVLQVSPSSLADYAKCPLCYWLERTQGVKWPRGAFPSLPGGMDRVLKTYYDEWRGRGALPPELVANGVSGLLFDKQELLNEWRNLRKGLVTMVNGVRLKGQLDDETLTWEEKKHVFDLLMDTAREESAKDSENKHFLKDVTKYTVAAIGGAVLLGVVFVGGRFVLERDDES